MKVLFATSEAHPLIKTGGLADVSGSLPQAIAALGHDVRLIMPAYQTVLDKYRGFEVIGSFMVGGAGRQFLAKLLEISCDGQVVWLVDVPEMFNRPGNPYLAPDGHDWWDNGERFGVFAKAVVEVAMNRAGQDWKADVVHANDWQTGLVPALLTLEHRRPTSVFTIHNMAYGGYFPKSLFESMGLPWHWWSEHLVEFYDNFSMLKAGITMADWVTTVSPTYAKQICSSGFAYGMEGALQKRFYEGRLVGILNGIDTNIWNPAIDDRIPHQFSLDKNLFENKLLNKQFLLEKFSDPNPIENSKYPLIGLIGRLVDQKGIDLVLAVLPDLLAHSDARFVFVGSGSAYYEQALRNLSEQNPTRIYTYIGYSEDLAHQVEAGADMFLMPSRFEPCGLNQMFSLAYGTLPIVHFTGGLADTVVNATTENVVKQQATGFVFYEPTAHALKSTIFYALELFKQPKIWQQIQKTGMAQVFDWEQSAQKYVTIYQEGN